MLHRKIMRHSHDLDQLHALTFRAVAKCRCEELPKIALAEPDFPEVLAAIAPRHLYIHAPQSDSNFRVESVKRCVQAARAVYGLFGVGDRIVAAYPPGEHGFPPEDRENAYQFIDKVLGISVNDMKMNK